MRSIHFQNYEVWNLRYLSKTMLLRFLTKTPSYQNYVIVQLIGIFFENIIRSSEVGQDDLRGVYIHILEEHVEVLV